MLEQEKQDLEKEIEERHTSNIPQSELKKKMKLLREK